LHTPFFINHYGFQAIALFNANKHEEAIQRVQELAADFPDTDLLACRVVEVSVKHSTKPKSVFNNDCSALRKLGLSACPTWDHRLGCHAIQRRSRPLHYRC
jgi:hypothetical protein